MMSKVFLVFSNRAHVDYLYCILGTKYKTITFDEKTSELFTEFLNQNNSDDYVSDGKRNLTYYII